MIRDSGLLLGPPWIVFVCVPSPTRQHVYGRCAFATAGDWSIRPPGSWTVSRTLLATRTQPKPIPSACLFASITNNREHVLHELLPPQSVASHNYNLQPRKHHFELPNKTSHLTDCNFMQRICYFSKPTDVPSSRVIFILFHSSIHISSSHTFKYCTLCVLTEFNKIHDDDDAEDIFVCTIARSNVWL